MPTVDLRLVKKEKLDDDETHHEPTMVYVRNSSALVHERHRNSRSVDAILRGDLKDSKDFNIDEKSSHQRRMSEENEPYTYRGIPIVYPIHSPPLDYQSISREEHSPSTKDYRLERDSSQSPPEQPRQLYEETNWSTGSPREGDSRLEDGSNFTYLSRLSPSHKNSPYSLSPRSESREDNCTSPKNTNSGANPLTNQSADERAVSSSRRRHIERFISSDNEKEEESLWKQVQRYRHRKRLPVGKLMATQEETIFMQYNEIRERRHREGRIATTRQTRSLSNNPLNEPSPKQTQQENEAKTDTDKPPSISPQLSAINESIADHATPYVTTRQHGVDLAPKSKGVTYVYVTAPPLGSPALPPNSPNPELHPGIYDGSHGNTEHIDSQSNKAKHGYHGYISEDPPHCHGYESRVIDARGRPIVRPGAVECRGFMPYDDCYHGNHMYHNHRSYRSTPRYHFNDNCHGSRKRRAHGCERHCCSRKRARPTSSEDDDDDYGLDNDKSRCKNDRHRENDDMCRHENGARQSSPASAGSRDNESVENEPTATQAKAVQDNESHSFTNGHLSREGSPTTNDGEENLTPHYNKTSIPREDSVRQQDDDVVCQVNGLFSLPGYRETKYDITKGELIRRTGLPETLTRVEMISYVRQAKTSGRILLDNHGITTSNRSHPTILSRVCEREAHLLASGIHKMNLEYLPMKNLVQRCVDMYKSRGCDGCQDCRLKLRRRLVDVEITR